MPRVRLAAFTKGIRLIPSVCAFMAIACTPARFETREPPPLPSLAHAPQPPEPLAHAEKVVVAPRVDSVRAPGMTGLKDGPVAMLTAALASADSAARLQFSTGILRRLMTAGLKVMDLSSLPAVAVERTQRREAGGTSDQIAWKGTLQELRGLGRVVPARHLLDVTAVTREMQSPSQRVTYSVDEPALRTYATAVEAWRPAAKATMAELDRLAGTYTLAWQKALDEYKSHAAWYQRVRDLFQGDPGESEAGAFRERVGAARDQIQQRLTRLPAVDALRADAAQRVDLQSVPGTQVLLQARVADGETGVIEQLVAIERHAGSADAAIAGALDMLQQVLAPTEKPPAGRRAR